MSNVVRFERLPRCDFCSIKGIDRPARYDFRTLAGVWANGCIDHYLTQRASTVLGTGHGQLLILPLDEVVAVAAAHGAFGRY